MSAPILIIHIPEDEAQAQRLQQRLEGSGLRTWRSGEVPVGESLTGTTSAMLARGGPVVICLSRLALGSGLPHLVANAVVSHSAAGNGQRLMPVQLENCFTKPYAVQFDVRIADCRGTNFEAGVSELLAALGHLTTDGKEGEKEADLRRYLERLRTHHRDLPVAGFETRVRIPIRLDDVYVPLKAMVYHRAMEKEHLAFGAARELEAMYPGEGLERAAQEREVAIDEALDLALRSGFRGMVVLGDPGSGKTTLLKHLVRIATDPEAGPRALGLPPDTVPALIVLRQLNDPTAGLTQAVIESVMEVDIALEDPREFARRLLRRDRLLILVDGLDEIGDLEQRLAVSRWLDMAIRQLPKSTFVVTSRYAVYRGDSRLSGRFLELHVREFTEPEARRFVSAWYDAVELQAELGRDATLSQRIASEAADDLSERIFNLEDPRTRSLRHLATNPLMLQILCLVHRDRKYLPERRVELYRECLQVLLELWRRAKEMPLTYTAAEALKLLQPLAFWLHSEKIREASLGELLERLATPLRELGRRPEDSADLLTSIRDQSGVLVSLSQGHYGFLHLSFQEYLCARHIQDRVLQDPGAIRALAGHFGDPWWREVVLLAMGLDNPSLFEPLMDALLKEELLHRDPQLADDALRDALARTPLPFLRSLAHGIASAEERYHALRLLRDMPGWEETPLEGGRSGRQLVEEIIQGDESRQVRTMGHELLGLPQIVAGGRLPDASEERINEAEGTVLVYVPGGEYLLGSRDLHDDLNPPHRVTLSPFWIGKYPVTNEQYARFLAANPEHREPAYWDNGRFNRPNQPVVGVSWRDACDYCAWAGLVLPSEAQWEAAARGTDARTYPWGEEEPDPKHANFDRGQGETTPVGAYPAGAGPYGTMDQAGNVWEWCADVWNERAHKLNDGKLDPVCATGEPAYRALRGGSWAVPAWCLPAAFRSGFWAEDRFRNIGFRCALLADEAPRPRSWMGEVEEEE